MIKCGTYPPRSFSPDDCYPSGSFQCVGASAGPATDLRSGISLGTYTAAYLDNGIYRVTLPTSVTFPKKPWAILVSAEPDAAAQNFSVSVVTPGLVAGTRTFDILCTNGGTSVIEPTTACRINWLVIASNNTGK